MRKRHLLIVMGISTLILAATQVKAQNRNCGPHDAVIAHLAEAYDETRRMIGLAANNSIVEILTAESGTWTILVTNPGGPTCLVASGTDMSALPDDPAGNDPDA